MDMNLMVAYGVILFILTALGIRFFTLCYGAPLDAGACGATGLSIR